MFPDNLRRPGATLQIAIWAAALSAFAVLGARAMFASLRDGYLLPATQYSSTDAYLTRIEANRAFSEMLVFAFGSFPRETPVLIVYRDHDFEAILLAQLMAYLSWPHEVQLIAVVPHALPPSLEPARLTASRAAVVACHVPLPPGSPPGISLAGNVWLAVPPSPSK